jgi:hypothetical protein
MADGGVSRRGEIDLADDFHDDFGFPRAHARTVDDFIDHSLVLGLYRQSAGLIGEVFLASLFHGGVLGLFSNLP